MRSASRTRLLILALACASQAQAQQVSLHVQRSTLAGYRYYQAPALAASIQPGASLDLVRESDNPYDANAVRVEWHGYKLGYVPRTRNAALAWAMDHGESVNASVAQGNRPRRIRARLEFDIFLR